MAMNDSSQTRIPKKRAISQLTGRKNFNLKVPNRFFYQVLPEKGPLLSFEESEWSAGSLSPTQLEYCNQKVEHQTEASNLIYSHSRKGNAQIFNQAYSQSQIKKKPAHQLPPVKRAVPTNQIVKSQLGCFNYFQILEKRQQAERKKRDFLTRLSSYVSQEDAPNQLLLGTDEQESYEEYDKRIMEIKFNLQKARRIRFTHKANWSISK